MVRRGRRQHPQLSQLLLPWLPGEVLQRELQPRPGARRGGKPTPAASRAPRASGRPGDRRRLWGSSPGPAGGTALARAAVQVPPGDGAVHMEPSPHAEDWAPAPAVAPASPQLARDVGWWVSANKGPQEHPLKDSQPNPILPCPSRNPLSLDTPITKAPDMPILSRGLGLVWVSRLPSGHTEELVKPPG